MSRFLRWRTMTWALVLWSAYVVAWTGITGSGPARFTLWWLAGTIALGSLRTVLRRWENDGGATVSSEWP